jgi:hypothetical protein
MGAALLLFAGCCLMVMSNVSSCRHTACTREMQLQLETYGVCIVAVLFGFWSKATWFEATCLKGPAIRDSRVGGILDWSFVVCTASSSLSVTNSIFSLCSSYDILVGYRSETCEGRTPVDDLAIVL